MKDVSSRATLLSGWSSSPHLHVSHRNRNDEYRLAEGRVEFRAAGEDAWRRLTYPEIQQHLVLGTAVASWLSRLYTTAKLAKILSA